MTGFLALEVAVATLSSPDISFANFNESNNNDDNEYIDNDYWSPPTLLASTKTTTTPSPRRTTLSAAAGAAVRAATKKKPLGAAATTPAPKFNARYFSTHRLLLPSTVPPSTTTLQSLDYSDEDFFDFDMKNRNITDDYADIDDKAVNFDDDSNSNLLLVIALSTLFVIIIAWTIIGNLIVFVCYINEKRLRTLSNLLILNLACCDLALAILVLPFGASNIVQGKWIFGELWCKLWLSIDVLFCTCSIWAIVAIGYDRYQAINALSSGGSGNAAGSSPSGLQRRNLKTTISLCIAVWVLSGLISIPPLIGWKTTDLYNATTAQCILFNTQGYVMYSASGSFLVPSIFIVVVYGKIFHAYMLWIRKRKKQLAVHPPAATTTTTTTTTTKTGAEMRKTTMTSTLSNRQGSQSSNTSGTTPINTNNAGLLLPLNANDTLRSKTDPFFDPKKHKRGTKSRSAVVGDEASVNEIGSSVNNTPNHRRFETDRRPGRSTNGLSKSPNHNEQASVSITNSSGSDDRNETLLQQRQASLTILTTFSGNARNVDTTAKPTSFSAHQKPVGSAPAKELPLLGTPWPTTNSKTGSNNHLLVPSSSLLANNNNSESGEIPAGSSSSEIVSSPPLGPPRLTHTKTSTFHRLLTPHWCPTSSSPPSSSTTSSSCCSKRRSEPDSAYNEQRVLQQLQTQTLASLSKLTVFSGKSSTPSKQAAETVANGGSAVVRGFSSEKHSSSSSAINVVNRSNSIGISFYPFTLRLNNTSPNRKVANGKGLPTTNGACARSSAETIVDETKIGRNNDDEENDEQQVVAFLNLVRPRAASSQSMQQRKFSKTSSSPSEVQTKPVRTGGGLFGSLWRLSKPRSAAIVQKSAASVAGGSGGEASADYEDESVINERDSNSQTAHAGALQTVADGRASQPYISYATTTTTTTTARTDSGRARSSAAVQAKQLIDAQNQKRLARRQAREARGLKIVFGILITYFVCWTGFFIMYILQGVCPSCPLPGAVFQTAIWLGYAQSAINPVMYFYTNRDFRTAFLNMVRWTPKKQQSQQRATRKP